MSLSLSSVVPSSSSASRLKSQSHRFSRVHVRRFCLPSSLATHLSPSRGRRLLKRSRAKKKRAAASQAQDSYLTVKTSPAVHVCLYACVLVVPRERKKMVEGNSRKQDSPFSPCVCTYRAYVSSSSRGRVRSSGSISRARGEIDRRTRHVRVCVHECVRCTAAIATATASRVKSA